MSSIIRMPGESYTDFQRRAFKAENPNADVDRIVGPATDGPRFPGETEAAWKERLANHHSYSNYRAFTLQPPQPDEDSEG